MTSLGREGRVSKSDVRIEAFGTLDELNAHLGLLALQMDDSAERERIVECQKAILVGAQYLHHDNVRGRLVDEKDDVMDRLSRLTADMETAIDRLDAELPPINNFVLPGGNVASASAHVARTVCRRAERCLVAASSDSFECVPLQVFINRLGDYLFVLARSLNEI